MVSLVRSRYFFLSMTDIGQEPLRHHDQEEIPHLLSPPLIIPHASERRKNDPLQH